MPRELDLDGLQHSLKEGDVQLIEVLPANEYELPVQWAVNSKHDLASVSGRSGIY